MARKFYSTQKVQKIRFGNGVFYHRHDDDMDDDWVLIAVLLVFLGLYWGLVHFLDWLTVDLIPWWAEPLTLFVWVPFVIVCTTYGKNPLRWWPLFLGTRVGIEEGWGHLYEAEDIVNRYGGPLNVYVDVDYIKFRRRRDAVHFCLVQQIF